MATAPSQKSQLPALTAWLILMLLWGLSIGLDSLWLWLDHTPPAWDQGDHLSRAMNYWHVLQHPKLSSGDWWTQLWRLSPTYRAPLVYILTVPFLAFFGAGADQAIWVNLGLTGVLLVAMYYLGTCLFSRSVGLWASGLCLLSQTLTSTRTDYLLDYGLATTLTVAFTCLTLWRYIPAQAWGWTILSGVSLGIVFLTRPTGLLFLVVPLVWLTIETLVKRQSGRFFQLTIVAVIMIALGFPWFSTNWLTIVSSILQANSSGAVYEGDPQANTLAGWLYYGQALPVMMSPPIVFVGIGCGLVGLGQWLWRWQKVKDNRPTPASEWGKWLWLLGFVGGIYVFCSLASNKDPRFIQPYLPVVGLLLARCLTIETSFWWQGLRWSTVAISVLLLISARFPIPGLAQLTKAPHFPYTGPAWPHQEVIAEVIRSQPYQRSTIGLVANTAEINPMNIDFFGAVANFQVYGRQLAFSEKTARQDSRSLDWYLTKTGNQGAYNAIEAGQKNLKQFVETSSDLVLHRTWPLPDKSQLRLYRRRVLPTIVEPLKTKDDRVRLTQVTFSNPVPPGQPVPITYELSGPWPALQEGLLLLTWQPETNSPESTKQVRSTTWFHDHGIGLGNLSPGKEAPSPQANFRVVERLAMLPPANLPDGFYRLTAAYLNRKTGKTYPLDISTGSIQINSQANPALAPELDLLTQFRQLARDLPQGKLDPIFAEIGRINQYDPTQDYLIQAQQLWHYRLQKTPSTELAYPLGLTYVLQQRAKPAIVTFSQITKLDENNPWAWTYLGFLHLYAWQPHLADNALNRAEILNPKLPEIKTLQGVAAAQQFKVFKAIRLLKG